LGIIGAIQSYDLIQLRNTHHLKCSEQNRGRLLSVGFKKFGFRINSGGFCILVFPSKKFISFFLSEWFYISLSGNGLGYNFLFLFF
jgi:hypothetical protein